MPNQLTDLKAIRADLIRCLGDNDQDYTLYPGADCFVDSFDAKTYISRINNRGMGGSRRLQSLYVHLPLCDALYFFCDTHQLNKNRRNKQPGRYIDYLAKEIRLLGNLFQNPLKVEQIHLGGGTPALLDQLQFSKLMTEIHKYFSLANDGFIRIMIDTQLSSDRSIKKFREMGVNYLTIGVPDFNLRTLQPTSRKQHEKADENQMMDAIKAAQRAGFNTIRIELIYGLPKQGINNFNCILDRIVAAQPDLINLRSYNHQLNERKACQIIQSVQSGYPPAVEDKCALRLYAINRLISAGYIHIGMNLFARQDNELVTAQQQGRLYYDLQGYSIYPDSDFIAIGMSAIGKTGSLFFQNHNDLSHYYERLEQNNLPVMRGLELSPDDILRRSVIHALICHSVVSFESVETFFSIDFKKYFSYELSEFTMYEKAGLLTVNDEEIIITPKGQLFVGGICRVFDKYLRTR